MSEALQSVVDYREVVGLLADFSRLGLSVRMRLCETGARKHTLT